MVLLDLPSGTMLTETYHFPGITPLHITMISNDNIGTDILLRFGANPKLLVSIFDQQNTLNAAAATS